MVPKQRNRRIALLLVGAVILALGTGLLLSALNENTQFFYKPSDVLAPGFEAQSDKVRIGGLVLEGTIEKSAGVAVRFDVADFPEEGPQAVDPTVFVRISYEGVLPDLFREGQGVVVTGRLINGTELVATEVLAKHDENYRPEQHLE